MQCVGYCQGCLNMKQLYDCMTDRWWCNEKGLELTECKWSVWMVCLVCVVQRYIMMMSDCSGEQKHHVTGWLQVVIGGCFWGKHHQLNGFVWWKDRWIIVIISSTVDGLSS